MSKSTKNFRRIILTISLLILIILDFLPGILISFLFALADRNQYALLSALVPTILIVLIGLLYKYKRTWSIIFIMVLSALQLFLFVFELRLVRDFNNLSIGEKMGYFMTPSRPFLPIPDVVLYVVIFTVGYLQYKQLKKTYTK